MARQARICQSCIPPTSTGTCKNNDKGSFIENVFIFKAMAPLQEIKDGSTHGITFPDSSEIKTEIDSKENTYEDLSMLQEPKLETLDGFEVKHHILDDDDFIDDMPDEDGSEEDEDSDFDPGESVRADLQCDICKEYFDNKSALSNHDCSSSFIDDLPKRPLKKTKRSVKTDFSCEICDFSTKNPKFLIAHVKNIHKKKDGRLACEECSLKFPSFAKLRIHLLKEHKLSKKPEKCLCTLCGKTLIGRSNLKKHEREKHGVDNAKFIRKDRLVKIQCHKCEEKFDSPVLLNSHVIDCTGESRKFPCISCDTKWACGFVLNIHLKIDHQMSEIHTCEKCGKCLKKKVSLSSHIKVDHENVKDHVCHLCGRGFARQQGLQFHIKRVHENSGKHFCDRCPFKAITKPELEIHINEVHTKAIKFHCQQCNFFCYRKGGLAAHVKNVHLKLRPHQCDTCGQAFVRRKELEKHKEWSNHS